MSSFSGTFNADNQAGNSITLRPGQSVSYSITTASLTGSVVFEKTKKIDQGFTIVDTMTDTDSGTYVNDSFEEETVRLRCVELDDDPGSETVSWTLDDVADEVSKEFINPETGLWEIRFTDSGVGFSRDVSIVNGALTLANSGLHLLDTDASHDLIVAPGSNLTADRTLTLSTGDANRTVTLSGNPTLSDWFDQSVKQAASPTFAGITSNGDIALSGGSDHIRLNIETTTLESVARARFGGDDGGNYWYVGKAADGKFRAVYSSGVSGENGIVIDRSGNMGVGTETMNGLFNVYGDIDLQNSGVISFAGTTVLNGQMSTVSDPAGGLTIDAECRAQLAALIDALQGVALMA